MVCHTRPGPVLRFADDIVYDERGKQREMLINQVASLLIHQLHDGTISHEEYEEAIQAADCVTPFSNAYDAKRFTRKAEGYPAKDYWLAMHTQHLIARGKVPQSWDGLRRNPRFMELYNSCQLIRLTNAEGKNENDNGDEPTEWVPGKRYLEVEICRDAYVYYREATGLTIQKELLEGIGHIFHINTRALKKGMFCNNLQALREEKEKARPWEVLVAMKEEYEDLLNAHKEKVAELESKQADLQRQQKKLEHEQAKTDAKVEGMKDEQTKAGTNVAETNADVQALTKRFEEYCEKNDEWKSGIEKRVSEVEKRMSAVEDKLKALDKIHFGEKLKLCHKLRRFEQEMKNVEPAKLDERIAKEAAKQVAVETDDIKRQLKDSLQNLSTSVEDIKSQNRIKDEEDRKTLDELKRKIALLRSREIEMSNVMVWHYDMIVDIGNKLEQEGDVEAASNAFASVYDAYVKAEDQADAKPSAKRPATATAALAAGTVATPSAGPSASTGPPTKAAAAPAAALTNPGSNAGNAADTPADAPPRTGDPTIPPPTAARDTSPARALPGATIDGSATVEPSAPLVTTPRVLTFDPLMELSPPTKTVDIVTEDDSSTGPSTDSDTSEVGEVHEENVADFQSVGSELGEVQKEGTEIQQNGLGFRLRDAGWACVGVALALVAQHMWQKGPKN